MNLFLNNWKDVATKAWSMWAWGCALIVMICDHLLPFAADLLPWWLSMAFATAGLVLRLVPQKNIPNTIKVPTEEPSYDDAV